MKGFKRVWDGLPATDAYFLGWSRGTMVAALSDNRRSPTATGQAIGWFVRDAMDAYDAYPPEAIDPTAEPLGCPVCGETALDLTGKLVCHPDQYVSRFAACDNCDRTVPIDELVTVQSSMYETKQCAKCRS